MTSVLVIGPKNPLAQTKHANAGRLASRGTSEQTLKVASHVGYADLSGGSVDADRAHGQAMTYLMREKGYSIKE